jgi:hypothetical protein
VTVAARKPGVREQTMRKRSSHGTLQHDKAEDGKVDVYIGAKAEEEAQGIDTSSDAYLEALVDRLRDQDRFVREEIVRKDAILHQQDGGHAPTHGAHRSGVLRVTRIAHRGRRRA